MDILGRIRQKYCGNMKLCEPYHGTNPADIPAPLYRLLCSSNGIWETMRHPKTGEEMTLSWILYPYDMIVESTAFFSSHYGVKGVVFSDDGAGNPYIIKQDEVITYFNIIGNEEIRIADTLSDFFR